MMLLVDLNGPSNRVVEHLGALLEHLLGVFNRFLRTPDLDLSASRGVNLILARDVDLGASRQTQVFHFAAALANQRWYLVRSNRDGG